MNPHRNTHVTVADGRAHAVWSRFNRILIFLIVLTIGIGISLAFSPEIGKLHDLEMSESLLAQAVSREKAQNDLLERQVYLIQHDEEFRNTVARDKLNLGKENELVFRFEDKTAP
jgi:cell division protein FtsB